VNRWRPRHTNWVQPITSARAAVGRCVRNYAEHARTGVLPVASVRSACAPVAPSVRGTYVAPPIKRHPPPRLYPFTGAAQGPRDQQQ